MYLYATLLFLHVLAIVVWVGGMFVMQLAVRPATAAANLQPQQRLPLLVDTLGRFFNWVSVAVVVTLLTGLAMIFGQGGFKNAHPSLHLMTGLGLLMMAIYGHLRFAPFKRARVAVAALDWEAAAKQLDQLRLMVSINLLLGIATIAVVTLGRAVF